MLENENENDGQAQSDPKPFSLDDVDDDALQARLSKLPAFAALLDPTKAGEKLKPAPLEGGGQRVRSNEASDTMSELVSTLVKGLKANAREEARAESKGAHAGPTTPVEATVKSAAQRFWGSD